MFTDILLLLALASGRSQAETEDFSWEDDDEDESSGDEEGDDDDDDDEGAEESATPSANTNTKSKPTATTTPVASTTSAAKRSSDTLLPAPPADKMHVSYPSSLVTSPTNTSPRESSDGYDVVSENSEGKKGAAMTKATGSTVKPTVSATSTGTAKAGEDEESGDSDWE